MKSGVYERTFLIKIAFLNEIIQKLLTFYQEETLGSKKNGIHSVSYIQN